MLPFRLPRLVAICAGIVTPLVAVSAAAQQPGTRASAQSAASGASLTPGNIALLAAGEIDLQALQQLRDALGHQDPSVRAVASRIAAVSKLAGLAPAISLALAREDIKWVAAEQIRALLLIDTPGARAAVAAHLHRGGVDALEAFLDHMVRTSPDHLVTELGGLLAPHDSATVARLVPVLARAFSTPGLGQGVLQELLRITSRESQRRRHPWRATLAALGPALDEAQAAVLRQALESTNDTIRQETVWALVARLAGETTVPHALLAMARPAPAAGATWEGFGRELIARRLESGDRIDHAELVKAAAKEHEGDARAAVALDLLTRAERDALKSLFGERFMNRKRARIELDAELRRRSVSARTLPFLWPRLYTTLFDAVNCPITGHYRFGALGFTYAADGRPTHVRIDPGTLLPVCQPALRALARLILPSFGRAEPSAIEWVIVPVAQEFQACFEDHVAGASGNEPPVEPWATATDSSTTVVAPTKIHNVNPEYPPAAQREKIQGVVVIESTISRIGCVPSASVVRSIPALDFSAVRAVLDWRFTPTISGGKAVPVIMTVTVNFELR